MPDRRWLRAAVGIAVLALAAYMVALSATRLPGDDTAPFVASAPGREALVRQMLLVALVIAVVVFLMRRPSRGGGRRRLRRRPSLLHTLLAVIVVGAFFWLLDPAGMESVATTTTLPPAREGSIPSAAAVEADGRAPGWELWAVVAAGVVALAYLMRSRTGAATAAVIGTPTTPLAPGTRSTLGTSADPRRRVIVAYLRLEEHAQTAGLARSAAETVPNHLGRIGDPAVRSSVQTLASAYDLARFAADRPDPAVAERAEQAGDEIGDRLP